jgi:hypothetical protein
LTILKNPFLVYLATFGAALGIYQLNWSEIYPPLSGDLLLFFGGTFVSALLLALLVAPAVGQTKDYRPGLLPKYTGLFIIATFAAEIALVGGIPLLLIARGASFYKFEAGATHLHVFVFWSVFSTIRFADYLYSGRRLYLLEAALPIIFYGLLVYRGPALISMLSWVFVFVIKHGGIKPKHGLVLAIGGILALLLNGLLGDVRSPGQERIGAPSAAFRNSGIPQTFFWSYLYATVPIANLQLSVDKLVKEQGTIVEFIASDLLPDTISKRLLPILNERIATGQGNLVSRDQLYSWEQPQVATGLNISSIFGRSYGFFGWLGPVILFVVLTIFIITYLILIARSPYRVPALALLNTLVVFCLFNNMLASAAMLPQLILVLLLPPWRTWTARRDSPVQRPV